MLPILKYFDNIDMIIVFLAPGLIILFVRSQFITGRQPHDLTAILSYLAVSIIYYALVFPVIELVPTVQEVGYQKAIAWIFLVFVGPGVLGFVLGIAAQKELLYRFLRQNRFLRRLRLNPVHTMPTAWDWKFATGNQQRMLVTLKDGKYFAGLYGDKSFTSSDPAERDIYIQQIYDLDEGDNWMPRGENGVLISADEIQSIEFLPLLRGGDNP